VIPEIETDPETIAMEIIAAGAGFLIAVLWFDLMFDVQVLAPAASQPSRSPCSIRSRGTTTA